MIPGVTGSCLYHKTAGALCSEFKADLPVELSESMGIHFARLIQMGAMNKLNIKSAHFRFDRYTVVGLPLDTGVILLTVCEADANCSLVATTATMLANDMRDDLTVSGSITGRENREVLSVDQAEEVGERNSVIYSLKAQLEEIENALAEAIGPVAGMIMTDYVNRWSEKGPVHVSRLGDLVTMLVEEIGDKHLARSFQKKLKHLFKKI